MMLSRALSRCQMPGRESLGLRCSPMLPVMQVGRVRPGAPPEHDVLHPVGGGLGQARPTNNIGMHG